MIEFEWLSFIHFLQENIRAESYQVLVDVVSWGETLPSSKGKWIVLPSSFIGGARYMIQNY